MAAEISQIFKKANRMFEEQNYPEAEQLYTELISSCSQSRDCDAREVSTAYNNRGQIKYLRVDFHEAAGDYTRAIDADGRFEVPFYNRGLIHYRLGFFNDAKSDFEQALKLKPDFEDAKESLRQTILDQQHRLTRGY